MDLRTFQDQERARAKAAAFQAHARAVQAQAHLRMARQDAQARLRPVSQVVNGQRDFMQRPGPPQMSGVGGGRPQPLVDCARRGEAFARRAVVGATDTMSPKDRELLSRLQALLSRLMAGDPEAQDAAAKLKASAKRGDRVAFAAWNTLAALYWQKNSPTWQLAEGKYAKLIAEDPQAQAWFRDLQVSARGQGPQADLAKKAFAMLKAIHNHRKESVWYPGAPRTGYYPMPTRHRPGIVIGGYVGAHPLVSHGNSGLGVNRSRTSGPFDNLPVLPQVIPPGLSPGQLGIPPVPGISPGLLGTLPGNLGSVPGAPGSPTAPLGSSVPGLPAIPGIAPSQLPGLLAQVPGLGNMVPGLANLSPAQIPGLLQQLGIDPSNLPALLSQVPGLAQVLNSPQGQALLTLGSVGKAVRVHTARQFSIARGQLFEIQRKARLQLE